MSLFVFEPTAALHVAVSDEHGAVWPAEDGGGEGYERSDGGQAGPEQLGVVGLGGLDVGHPLEGMGLERACHVPHGVEERELAALDGAEGVAGDKGRHGV